MVRTAWVALVLAAGLSAAGCTKKDVLVAKVEAVYLPTAVAQYQGRLPPTPPDANIGPPDGTRFVVVATSIRNATASQQSLDQDRVELVDQFGNTVKRLGITYDCNDVPSEIEYEGKLGKLLIGAGQTLRNDPRATCFIFMVPDSAIRLSLRIPGAADTPVHAPAPPPSAAPASAAPASAQTAAS
jgi:hypothetical protein